MKAGAFTPAIPGDGVCDVLRGQPRSMKAGAFTPAIPHGTAKRHATPTALNEGGGLHPRNPVPVLADRDAVLRSMKAGAFTPAIPRCTRRAG